MDSLMKGMAISATAVLLCACLSTRKTYNQTGQKAYSISCLSPFHSWRSCLVKAGRLCGSRGYTVSASDEFDRLLVISCMEH